MSIAVHANLAVAKLANSPGNAGVTIELEAGQGSRFPTTASGAYPAFIYPEGQIPTPSNCEIVSVTARTADKLTVVRNAEEGSGKINMASGMLIIAGATAKTFQDIENSMTAEMARAIMSEGELASLLSEAQAEVAELQQRVTVIESRLGGLAGSGKPTVSTSVAVIAASPESLTLKGTIVPNGATTKYWFEFGETESLGNTSPVQTPGWADTGLHFAEQTLTSLSPTLSTSMFYRLVAENSNGRTNGPIVKPGSNGYAGLADWEGIPDIEKYGLANVERQLSEMAAIGVSWVRADFAWDAIQPTEGTFAWANYDKFMELCKGHGFKVIGVLGFTPKWANGGKAREYPPTSVAQFATFCKEVATRYAGMGMVAFEIWNEPNITQFWKGVAGAGPEPEGKYYELLKAAYAAIHEASPSAVVTHGGLSPAGEEAGIQIKPEVFFKKLYEKHATELGKSKAEVAAAKVGSTGLFDAAAYHPYVDSTPGNTSGLGFNWEVLYEKAGTTIRGLMEEWGDSAKTIYATEVGCRWENLMQYAPTSNTAEGASLVNQTGSLAAGFVNGAKVKIEKITGAVTGLVAGTTYFVVGAVTNGYELSATEGGAAIKVGGHALEVASTGVFLNNETLGREAAAARLKLALEKWATYTFGGLAGAPLCWFTMYDPGVFGLVDGSFTQRPEYAAYKSAATGIGITRPSATYAATPVTNVSTAGFTGNALVNPNGAETTLTWEWGTGSVGEKSKAATGKPTGRSPVNTSTAVATTLVAGSTYKYRLKAVNSAGTSTLAEGTFTVGTTNETLLGEPSTPTGGLEHQCKDSKGRVEAFPYTVGKTGTLKEIKFNKSKVSDGGTITSVRAAAIADDGTGKPVITSVLTEGHKTLGEEANIAGEGVTVTIPLESTLAVTAGEKLWIALLPIGGRIYVPAFAKEATGQQQYQSTPSGTEYTEIKGVGGWEGGATRAQGPCQVWGVGTTTTVNNVPTLALASGNEEVEWASVGGETQYEVRISKQPVTVEGRIAGIVEQAKGSNPQKFKPVANGTYGTSPQVTITPGSTAYIEVRAAGTSAWSNAIGVAIPGEAVTVRKGVEMGGWGAGEEVGDMEEAHINVTRLNKPSAARVAELESKGVAVIYLYAYDTGGQNKSGVKAINRTAWVADAIKKIKEVKPKYFEALNEPAGSWFWGEGAGNAAEAEAYVKLIELLWAEVQKLPSGERPKILVSLDGGKSTSKEWVEKLKAVNASFTSFFDYGTCHAYYKVGGNATGKLGNRGNVLAIYTYIGKARKIAVTEIGWPTLKETGDSYKYSEAEQAEAVGGWLAWTKASASETAVVLTTIYGYRDGSGEPPGYGLWHQDDSPKPAVGKVAAA